MSDGFGLLGAVLVAGIALHFLDHEEHERYHKYHRRHYHDKDGKPYIHHQPKHKGEFRTRKDGRRYRK